ncbi:hypothetical protein [Streptomyces californicus]
MRYPHDAFDGLGFVEAPPVDPGAVVEHDVLDPSFMKSWSTSSPLSSASHASWYAVRRCHAATVPRALIGR